MADRADILVVEDEAAQRELIADILRRTGHHVVAAESVDSALAVLADRCPDLVLCDWRMPGRTGGELLDRVRELGLEVGFVVMTAYGSIAHAVEAVQRGADDYLSKPFEREALLLAVDRVLRTRRLELENRRLREVPRDDRRYGDLIGGSVAMQSLYRTMDKVAGVDATVLVTGESGTGKELVARTLHRRSPRCGGPFVAVNCAAIPENLIESELFGHEKGAFTGATHRRLGRFEEADGGTLFLDEIASMPVPLQATLLRVLQDRTVTRLGGAGEVKVDVRVVAASNRDLPAMVRSGGFREDLYYRLNVVQLTTPPLRERREDIPLLARHFLTEVAERHGLECDAIPSAVLRPLMEHPWPGNVRELANAVERLALLADGGTLRPDDLPPEVRSRTRPDGCPFELPAEGLDWDQMERGLLRQALATTGGNRAAAARRLGLGYKALLYRLEKHGMDSAEGAEPSPPPA